MLVPERLWAEMTDAEKTAHKAAVEALRSHARDVVCPSCQQKLRIFASYEVRAVDGATDTPAPLRTSKDELHSVHERRLLEAARACGLLDAFAHAMREEKKFGGTPSDAGTYLLYWWSRVQPLARPVPAVTMAAWIEEFGGRVTVVGAEGIIAVLSDGLLKQFVPARFIWSVASTGGRARMPVAPLFEQWRRGKYGYVPVGASRFLEAMNQPNAGHFGRMVQ